MQQVIAQSVRMQFTSLSNQGLTMDFHPSALNDFRNNCNAVKPMPIAVLFKNMGAWSVLCFAVNKDDAQLAIGQEMSIDPTNDEFLIYGAPSKYLLETCSIYKLVA